MDASLSIQNLKHEDVSVTQVLFAGLEAGKNPVPEIFFVFLL